VAIQARQVYLAGRSLRATRRAIRGETR